VRHTRYETLHNKKGKRKHHAVKTYWGSGDIAQRILNLGARWE